MPDRNGWATPFATDAHTPEEPGQIAAVLGCVPSGLPGHAALRGMAEGAKQREQYLGGDVGLSQRLTHLISSSPETLSGCPDHPTL